MVEGTTAAARMDAVFHALSHGARRDMLGRLADSELTVGELAEPLSMSLAAASKHIKVLERAGLVGRTVDGRRHVCRLDAAPLRPLAMAAPLRAPLERASRCPRGAHAHPPGPGGSMTLMTAEERAVVRLQRRIPAPPDEVYRAWLDPDLLAPLDGARGPERDARRGRRARRRPLPHLAGRRGGRRRRLRIGLLELVPSERIVLRWGFVGPDRVAGPTHDSQLTVTLRERARRRDRADPRPRATGDLARRCRTSPTTSARVGDGARQAGGGRLMLARTGTREEWLQARVELLAAEKEHTRAATRSPASGASFRGCASTSPTASRREDGPASLADLFGGARSCIVHHFMFPGCPSCSSVADGYDGFVVHLEQHDVAFTAVSRYPVDELVAYRERMGWSFPWASSLGSAFGFDAEVEAEHAAERRRPREAPAHPLPVGDELVHRVARDRGERDVVLLEVDDEAVVAVGHRRAARTAGEHEVVDDELRTPAEQVGQRRRAVLACRSGRACRHAPTEARAAGGRARRPPACAPSRRRAAPRAPEATPRACRSGPASGGLRQLVERERPPGLDVGADLRHRGGERLEALVDERELVAPPGASANVTVSRESCVGSATRSGPTKRQRKTIRSFGTSSISSESKPPTSPSALACQTR